MKCELNLKSETEEEIRMYNGGLKTMVIQMEHELQIYVGYMKHKKGHFIMLHGCVKKLENVGLKYMQ